MPLPKLKDTRFWGDLVAVVVWGAVKAWRALVS